MKKFCLSISALLLFTGFMFGQAAEKDEVRVPLENYIKAHATGDPSFARKAFHTDGTMLWMRDGKYNSENFEAFITRAFTGKPATDEQKRKDHRRIESIDVSGNAANAKIVLNYPTVKFVDYMTLLKIDGEWKIVSKVFYAEPKQQPAEPRKKSE